MLLWRPGDSAYRDTAVVPWKEALDRPGAVQLGHLRRLVESRPMLDRVPDQSLLTGDEMNDRIQATRGKDYAMIYSTSGSRIEVHLGRISGEQLHAWWFDPRSGEARDTGMHPNRGRVSFQPPSLGLGHDWVLVLDDASKNFPRPGNAKN
jgi:Putative collagen-binding domain of a collagenase